MKSVCIPSPPASLGGPASFVRLLTRAFADIGIEIVNNPVNEAVDAVLVIQSTRHVGWLRKQKRRGIPITQRLNGIKGYSSNSSLASKIHWDDWARNSVTNFIRRHLASDVIYQSEFSQRIWTERYGPTGAKTNVIYNGTDIPLTQNTDSANSNGSNPTVLIVEGGLDEPGILTKATGTWEALSRRDFKGEIRMAGRLSSAGQSQILRSPQFSYLGVLSKSDVATEMERATVLLSAETAPPCPNVVIEAMSAGLPVVGFNSGSLMELVDDETLIVGTEGMYAQPSAEEFESIASVIVDAAQRRKALSENARKRAAEFFDIRNIAKSYAAVLGV